MKRNSQHMATYRAGKRAAGLCAYGGCEEPSGTAWYCDRHRLQVNALQRARKLRQLCRTCRYDSCVVPIPRSSTARYCPPHALERQRAWQRQYWRTELGRARRLSAGRLYAQRKKAQGYCAVPGCWQPPGVTLKGQPATICETHLGALRARWQRSNANRGVMPAEEKPMPKCRDCTWLSWESFEGKPWGRCQRGHFDPASLNSIRRCYQPLSYYAERTILENRPPVRGAGADCPDFKATP